MENNVIFHLMQAVWIWDSSWIKIRVSADYETKEPINTNWEIVSVVFKNSSQLERFEAKFSNWYMEIIKRGLWKWKDTTEKQEFKRQWNAWEIGYITLLSHNLFDANKSVTIKNWNRLYFWWEGAYIESPDKGETLVFKDEKNAVISLSDISSKTGQNNKVAINDTDTPWFLKDKLWNWFKIWAKVEVDYESLDFSNAPIKDSLSSSDYYLTSDKKRVQVFKNNATVDETTWLSNDFKNITPFGLGFIFRNLNMTQVAAAADSVRFSDDSEFRWNVNYYKAQQDVKKFQVRIDWKIRLKFKFKHWYKTEQFNVYDIKYFIFVNDKQIIDKDFNFDNQDERRIRWSDDEFNNAPYMEQIYDIDVKSLDIITIKVWNAIRTSFRDFRVCFDYEYFRPWNFL